MRLPIKTIDGKVLHPDDEEEEDDDEEEDEKEGEGKDQSDDEVKDVGDDDDDEEILGSEAGESSDGEDWNNEHQGELEEGTESATGGETLYVKVIIVPVSLFDILHPFLVQMNWISTSVKRQD